VRVFCLDDERTLPKGIGLDWICVESVEDGLKIIQEYDPFDAWWLDHDLGEESPSGFDFLKMIQEQDLLDKLPKEIKVHSMNPIGAQRMVWFCQEVLKVSVTRAIFPKEG
jgi:hypothetical protein